MENQLLNIVSKSNFQKEFEKKTHLIDCEISQMKYTHNDHMKNEKKYLQYKNRLFYTFWKKIQKRDNYKLIFQLILNKYLTMENTFYIMNIIHQNKIKNDYDICKEIFKLPILKNKQDYFNEYNITLLYENFKRNYQRYFGISYEDYLKIKNATLYMNMYKIKYKLKYLDFGCQNNNNTILFKNAFHIKDNDVYGIAKYKPKNFIFNFENIKEDDKINFPDQYFDYISCFFSLEKIPNILNIMKELKRILKPNGFIFIFNHEYINIYDHFIYDINDMLYYFKNNDLNKNNWKKYIDNYSFHRYFNFIELDILFEKYDFKLFSFKKIRKNFYYTPELNDVAFKIYMKN
jgi:SAM-dependent methyltransferase